MPAFVDGLLRWQRGAWEPRQSQLFLTALLSASIAVGAVLGYQSVQRSWRSNDIKFTIHEHPIRDPIADKVAEYSTHTHTIRDNGTLVQDGKNPPQPKVEQPKFCADGMGQFNPDNAADEEDEDKRSALLALRVRQGDYDDDLILEQLARNRVFLTDEGLQKLRSAFIIVVGCGGVGSHATAALARSGVSRIRLIDFDQVTLSSLNRHAVATLADVGIPKVHCLRKRLQQIAPWVQFDCRNELFRNVTADVQLAPWDDHPPDYILDAIDNIDSKVELLRFCHDKSIRVISSMGAGCKSDPTRVFLGDISQSVEDPLSRSTRRRLRALGVTSGIPVCFSAEKMAPGKAQLLPLPEEEFQKGKVGELGVLPDFRVRILPVLGTMPAVFGLCIANHIMLEITGYPHEYLQSKTREKLYEGILGNLQGLEERLARWSGQDAVGLRIPVSVDDVGYIVEEVYRGRSVVSGLITRLTLIRWGWRKEPVNFVDTQFPGQKYSRLELNDLVCMTKEEALQHERKVLMGEISPTEMYESSVIERVAERMAEEVHFQRWR